MKTGMVFGVPLFEEAQNLNAFCVPAVKGNAEFTVKEVFVAIDETVLLYPATLIMEPTVISVRNKVPVPVTVAEPLVIAAVPVRAHI